MRSGLGQTVCLCHQAV